MPSKQRHAKGRQPSRSKKRKSTRGSLATAAEQPVVSQTYEPVSRTKAPETLTSAVNVPASSAVSTVQYPYIVPELRRIGILSGIMLAVLIVLALVLP